MVPVIWSVTERVFSCPFLHFCPFTPPLSNNLKNQNFEKMKKMLGDTIVLHKRTINDNHMMYGSRDMEHTGHNFLSFWTFFALLPT